MALMTISEVEAYLQARAIAFESVKELTDGTANYVFLVSTSNAGQFILKHAEPFVKFNTAILFSISRMMHEARALQTIPELLPTTIRQLNVHLPSLYHQDTTQHVLHISYGGPENLKTAFTESTLDLQSIGRRLGLWLSQLHRSSTATAIGTTLDNNNDAAVQIYGHCYRNLSTVLKSFGFDESIGSLVLIRYGQLLETDNDCICHGDFWTGNILLAIDTTGSITPRLTVIDWEMTRRGCGATDVGQFAAEAYLLEHFRGRQGLLSTFLQGYAEASVLSNQFVKRIVVHFGTHLAFWPSHAGWGSRSQIREVMETAIEYIQRADSEDWVWLKASIFGPLLVQSRMA